MPDLLVKLYELPPSAPALERLRGSGIEIRRAIAAEKSTNSQMGRGAVFGRVVLRVRDGLQPSTGRLHDRRAWRHTLSASRCHGVVCPDFFGPLGVAPNGENTTSARLCFSPAWKRCVRKDMPTPSSAGRDRSGSSRRPSVRPSSRTPNPESIAACSKSARRK